LGAWLIFDHPKFHVKPFLGLILGFLLIATISLFHVEQRALGFYGLFKWIEMFALLLYIKETFWTHSQYFVSFIILFSAAVFQSILAIVQFHVQHGLGAFFLGEYIAPAGTAGLAVVSYGTEKFIRAYGTMPHPNVLGAFLILGLVIGLYFVSTVRNRWPRILVSCATLVITLGVFTTFSRIAWLAAVLIYSIFLIHWFHKKQFAKIWLILAIGIVSGGIIITLWAKYLFFRAGNIDSQGIESRSLFNTMAVKLVKQFPLLGSGVGNTIEALKVQAKLEPWQYQPGHNIFLVIATELGLIALGIFLTVLYKIIAAAKRASRELLSFSVLVIGGLFIAMGQFDHYFVTIQQGRLMFFVVLGLLAALPNLKSDYENSD
jgi:O-antigen ligase